MFNLIFYLEFKIRYFCQIEITTHLCYNFNSYNTTQRVTTLSMSKSMSSGILGGFDQIRSVAPVVEAAVFPVSRGRFGVIRECRENATGKIYMAKIIPYCQESKQEVLKEYEILKSLHNEKVMALHEAYITPRYLVLVAEYCTGKELLFSLTDR